MTTVLVIAAVLLFTAAAITTFRLLAGPGTLDRIVAVDTLMALAIAGLAVWAMYSRDTTLVPATVALALVGFAGSISIARFRVADK